MAHATLIGPVLLRHRSTHLLNAVEYGTMHLSTQDVDAAADGSALEEVFGAGFFPNDRSVAFGFFSAAVFFRVDAGFLTGGSFAAGDGSLAAVVQEDSHLVRFPAMKLSHFVLQEDFLAGDFFEHLSVQLSNGVWYLSMQSLKQGVVEGSFAAFVFKKVVDFGFDFALTVFAFFAPFFRARQDDEHSILMFLRKVVHSLAQALFAEPDFFLQPSEHVANA